jgi:phosphoesterase RecJ-like protein
VLISERDDEIKLSLRSKGDFSVNDLAKKHFNGGGHRNAAGGSSELSFDETIKKFENILKEYKEELNAQVSEFII